MLILTRTRRTRPPHRHLLYESNSMCISVQSRYRGRFRSMITVSTIFCFARNVIDYHPAINAARPVLIVSIAALCGNDFHFSHCVTK